MHQADGLYTEQLCISYLHPLRLYVVVQLCPRERNVLVLGLAQFGAEHDLVELVHRHIDPRSYLVSVQNL
jgi:hypothetical protein